MPKRLIKHSSGYVCDFFLRDDWQVGQQIEGQRLILLVGGTNQSIYSMYGIIEEKGEMYPFLKNCPLLE